jgi:hypothetical protein
LPPGGAAGVDFVAAGGVDLVGAGAAELAVVRAAAVGVPDLEAGEADAVVDAALGAVVGVVVDAAVDAVVIEEAGAGVDAVGSAVALAPRCDRPSQPVAKMARAAMRVPAAAALGVCLMPHLRPAAP